MHRSVIRLSIQTYVPVIHSVGGVHCSVSVRDAVACIYQPVSWEDFNVTPWVLVCQIPTLAFSSRITRVIIGCGQADAVLWRAFEQCC